MSFADQDVFEVRVVGCDDERPLIVCEADFRSTCDQAFFTFDCRIYVNSPVKSSDYNITKFKTRFRARGNPHNLIEKITSKKINWTEVGFTTKRESVKFFPSSHRTTRRRLTTKASWNQPLLREVLKEPPLMSYKNEKSLTNKVIARSHFSHHHTTSLWVVSSLSTVHFTFYSPP